MIIFMASVESLFGCGDGLSEPWHQFHMCQIKEVSQETLEFLHSAAGLYGDKHPILNLWVIDMNLWAALLKYLSWCQDEQLDFSFHLCKVQEADEFYIRMVTEKLKQFGAD